MIGIRIQSVDAVIATVAVSSVVTAICGMVIVANVHDALHGTAAMPLTARSRPRVSPREAIGGAPLSRWPGAPGLAMPLGFERSAPGLAHPGTRQRARPCLRACPRSTALSRRRRAPHWRSAARGRNGAGLARHSARACATLRTPIARPAGFAALPPLDGARRGASPLLVSLSPRPPARPGAAARVIAARAPAQPIAENIEVARAEAPEASADTRAPVGRSRPRAAFPAARRQQPLQRASGPRNPAPSGQRGTGLRGPGQPRQRLGLGPRQRDHFRGAAGQRARSYPRASARALHRAVGGRQTEIVICVTPDYLAVGSNAITCACRWACPPRCGWRMPST
jgi:hypothetical protein